MRVLLVGSELEENLAIRYLASALEAAGHEAELRPFSSVGDGAQVVEAARRSRPDVVGLSMTFQRRAEEFGELATALRQAGFSGHITAGGHFPTFAQREVLERYPALDSVVRHEGEVTLVELCQRLATSAPLGDVLGLVSRRQDGSLQVAPPRPLASDLDAIRFPKRVGEPQLHMGVPAAFLIGTRGCYGHCTFCCINAYIDDAGGERYRSRSADNVADEVAWLRRERGARMLVFHDDDFFTRDAGRDLRRVTSLRDAFRRRGVDDVALVLKARPDDLDHEVFRVLREIGLLRVYIGIEAGSSQGLKTLGRGVDIRANQRALDFLRRIDVYACFNMLIFDPETRVASLRESLAFLKRNADVPMNFCRTEIYPGTPLHRKLAREGRLIGDVFGWDYEIREPAAERAFRLFARAFLDRNFRCDGLMNSNLSLGYYWHLLRQFYPKALTPALHASTLETIRQVNLDSVARLSELVDFAESPRSLAPAAFDDFAGIVAEEIERANAKLEARVAEASQDILNAARGVVRPRPLARWSAAAAAAIALSPLACDPLAPPPPDPLPPPHMREQHEGPPYEQTGGQPDASEFAEPPPDLRPDAGPVYLPPPDPPPPPTTKPKPPPPPPPDPLPPPTMKK
ncbi:MAG: cobalamin B12-binding domain-containing protein [Polyangiaceae bacterium]|nr:cobalamin B12-binding domain-containing protein [Polyangiaceae bacterium]